MNILYSDPLAVTSLSPVNLSGCDEIILLPEDLPDQPAGSAVSADLLVPWGVGEKNPWGLATNLPARQMALRFYRLRMWAEEMFGDFKKMVLTFSVQCCVILTVYLV